MSAATTPPPTPVPPARLVAAAAEAGDVLGSLVALTGAGGAWSVRVLRRNVELARRCPAALERAPNQLDFIEELAGAAWDAADDWRRRPLPTGPSPAEAAAREAHRQALVERLDGLADELCRRAEAWVLACL